MLAGHLPLDSHQLEAGGLVQPDGGLVVPGDAGDDRVEPVSSGQGSGARPARPGPRRVHAGSGRRRPSPRRWPSTPSAPGRWTATRSRARSRRCHRPGPGDPEPSSATATTAGWTPWWTRIQASCSDGVRGHHVEGVGAVEDLDVVDRANGLGVGEVGQSDPHRPMVPTRCPNRGANAAPTTERRRPVRQAGYH